MTSYEQLSGAGNAGRRGLWRRFRLPFALVSFALVYGVMGYVLLAHFPFLDALYMTTITLTTIGFGEIRPLDAVGRAFTLSLIVVGVVAVFSALGVAAQALATGELGDAARRRRMERRLKQLEGHFIVCGYGRVGAAAVKSFRESDAGVVVIDLDSSLREAAEAAGAAFLAGDATQDEALRSAGVERARGLVAAIGSDATNVYITLTARALSAPLFIVSRASSADAVAKLQTAGANRVASPYLTIGKQLAQQSLRPAVVEFLDHVGGTPGVSLEELLVADGSPLENSSIAQLLEEAPGVVVLALRRRRGELLASPPPEARLERGDVLVVLGPEELLGRLAE